MQNFNADAILDDVTSTLSALSAAAFVSRDAAGLDAFRKNTASTQLPALFVFPRPDSASSAQSLSAVHGEMQFRLSVVGRLSAPSAPQTAALALAETVLTTLFADPFRGGLSEDTRLEALSLPASAAPPFAEFRLDLVCPFVFTR